MSLIDVTAAADITAVCGSSGTGKSAWIKRQIKKESRVIVWDIDDEYSTLPGFERITTIPALVRRLTKAKHARIAYVSNSLSDFDAWARAAFAWARCLVIAEETADVTSPGKAPPGWGTLLRRGRKRMCRIIAVTQRPSESDKTAIGNATLLHVCDMTRVDDRAYMAKEMGIVPGSEDWAHMNAMPKFGYMEKRAGSREILRGVMVFKGGKA